FTNASLGSSVFMLDGGIEGLEFAVAGMLTLTVPTAGTFQGVADIDQQGVVWNDRTITGNYSISDTVGAVTYNGYGSLTVTRSTSSAFTTVGVYMTDPSLNLNDPNNPSGGG